MVAWHGSKGGDIALRAVGVLLCVVAYLATTHLIALQAPLPDQTVGAESFVLAIIGFLCASGGSAMLCLGHHLFDQVEISARWGTGRLIPLDDAPETHWSSDRDADATGPWNARRGQTAWRSVGAHRRGGEPDRAVSFARSSPASRRERAG